MVNAGTSPDAISFHVIPSLEPDSVYVAGSRSGASFAEVKASLYTTPPSVLIERPDGVLFFPLKFKYLV